MAASGSQTDGFVHQKQHLDRKWDMGGGYQQMAVAAGTSEQSMEGRGSRALPREVPHGGMVRGSAAGKRAEKEQLQEEEGDPGSQRAKEVRKASSLPSSQSRNSGMRGESQKSFQMVGRRRGQEGYQDKPSLDMGGEPSHLTHPK